MSAVHDIVLPLADSSQHHNGAWWFPFGLLWAVAPAAVIWFVARKVRARERSATDILAARYAHGELSSEEYRERLNELRRHE
jgi:uncharacterized membrane protein